MSLIASISKLTIITFTSISLSVQSGTTIINENDIANIKKIIRLPTKTFILDFFNYGIHNWVVGYFVHQNFGFKCFFFNASNGTTGLLQMWVQNGIYKYTITKPSQLQ